MGDIKNSIIVFLVGLVIFHALIYLGRTSKRFWTKIDYIWVSLAFLGVIGVNRDIRKLFTERQINDSKFRIHWQYEEAIKSAKLLETYYDPKTTRFQYMLFEDKDEASAFIRAAAWYHALGDSLEKYKVKILEQDDFTLLKSVKNYYEYFPFPEKRFFGMKDMRQIVGVYIDGAFKEAEIINKILESERLNNEWELFLKVFSPWLLAFAIAMRLSKVTAQLKGIA